MSRTLGITVAVLVGLFTLDALAGPPGGAGSSDKLRLEALAAAPNPFAPPGATTLSATALVKPTDGLHRHGGEGLSDDSDADWPNSREVRLPSPNK